MTQSMRACIDSYRVWKSMSGIDVGMLMKVESRHEQRA